MSDKDKLQVRITEEEAIQEKIEKGVKWKKVYFGGGSHYRNWLSQCEELAGKENVRVEEINSEGFKCFENQGEKLYRIWIKQKR